MRGVHTDLQHALTYRSWGRTPWNSVVFNTMAFAKTILEPQLRGGISNDDDASLDCNWPPQTEITNALTEIDTGFWLGAGEGRGGAACILISFWLSLAKPRLSRNNIEVGERDDWRGSSSPLWQNRVTLATTYSPNWPKFPCTSPRFDQHHKVQPLCYKNIGQISEFTQWRV